MSYCDEYKNWVDETVNATFSIKETSANLNTNDEYFLRQL